MIHEAEDEEFVELLSSGDINRVRDEVLVSGRYHTPFLANLDRLQRRNDLDRDFFLRVVLAFEENTWTMQQVEFLFAIFDVFVEDGRLFKNPRKLLAIFYNMFWHNDLLFYVIVASYVSKQTWRLIYEETMALHERPGFEEIFVVGLYSCLKMGNYFFTFNEGVHMAVLIRTTFMQEYTIRNTNRFIVFVRDVNLLGEAMREEIGVAAGEEVIDQRVDSVDTTNWDQVLSIVDMNAFEYNQRQFREELSADPEINTFIVVQLQRRFDEAKKRLDRPQCVDEFIDYMLGMVSLNLPVYLYYEISLFALECVRNGTLSQFNAMQIVSRVVALLRNARLRRGNQ